MHDFPFQRHQRKQIVEYPHINERCMQRLCIKSVTYLINIKGFKSVILNKTRFARAWLLEISGKYSAMHEIP